MINGGERYTDRGGGAAFRVRTELIEVAPTVRRVGRGGAVLATGLPSGWNRSGLGRGRTPGSLIGSPLVLFRGGSRRPGRGSDHISLDQKTRISSAG